MKCLWSLDGFGDVVVDVKKRIVFWEYGLCGVFVCICVVCVEFNIEGDLLLSLYSVEENV